MLDIKRLVLCVTTLVAAMGSPSFAQLPSLTFLDVSRTVGFERDTRPVFGAGNFQTQLSQEITNDGFGLFEATIGAPSFDNGDPFSPISFPALDPIASQSTTIGFNSISGIGSIDSRFFTDPGGIQEIRDQGMSTLSAVFDLSGPTEFTFDSSIDGFGSLEVLLFDGEADDDFDFVAGTSVFGPFENSEAGTLDAGQYELVARFSPFATAPLGDDGSFEFNFQVNVVPEPATLPFLLTAAIFGATKRRRRVKS